MASFDWGTGEGCITGEQMDETVEVKMFVFDGVSPIPTRFQSTVWDAVDILLAYALLYRDDPGGFVLNGYEWEGVWADASFAAVMGKFEAEAGE